MDLLYELAGYLFVLAIALVAVGGLTNFWVGAYITRQKVQGLSHLTPASFLGLLVVRFVVFVFMAVLAVILFGLVLGSFGTVMDFIKAAEYLSAVVIIAGVGAAIIVAKILTKWVEEPRAKYSILLLIASLIMSIGMILLSYEGRISFESTSFGVRRAAEWLTIVLAANVVFSVLVYVHNRVYEAWFSYES